MKTLVLGKGEPGELAGSPDRNHGKLSLGGSSVNERAWLYRECSSHNFLRDCPIINLLSSVVSIL